MVATFEDYSGSAQHPDVTPGLLPGIASLVPRKREIHHDLRIHLHGFVVQHVGAVVPLADGIKRCLDQHGMSAEHLEILDRASLADRRRQQYLSLDSAPLAPMRDRPVARAGSGFLQACSRCGRSAPARRERVLGVELAWTRGSPGGIHREFLPQDCTCPHKEFLSWAGRWSCLRPWKLPSALVRAQQFGER